MYAHEECIESEDVMEILKDVCLVSLGCDKNLTDSENMLGRLRARGYNLVASEDDAQIIIVNTCGFIKAAVDEAEQALQEALSFKQEASCKLVIAAGCMVQRYKGELAAKMPDLDGLLGVFEIDALVDIIENAARAQGYETPAPRSTQDEAIKPQRVVSTPKHYAYLKIAEGCNNHCAYCTIPSIRGRYTSRSIEELADEAEILVRSGCRELILVAQDTALYGIDLYGEPVLHELLQELSGIDGLWRMRIMYAYPEHLTDAVITEMATNPKICHYLDLPIQHASDNVLKLMGRRSTQKDLEALVTKLRIAMPDIALRTTIMTGFPGETEKDVEDLLNFLKFARFDRLGCFEYSREEGTRAYDMDKQVPENIKKRRAKDVMKVQAKISRENLRARRNMVCDVIIDFADEQGYAGRSYAEAPDVDGLVLVKSKNVLYNGDIVTVRVTDSGEHDLTGVLL